MCGVRRPLIWGQKRGGKLKAAARRTKLEETRGAGPSPVERASRRNSAGKKEEQKKRGPGFVRRAAAIDLGVKKRGGEVNGRRTPHKAGRNQKGRAEPCGAREQKK